MDRGNANDRTCAKSSENYDIMMDELGFESLPKIESYTLIYINRNIFSASK